MKLFAIALTLLTQSVLAQSTYQDVQPIIKNNCLLCHSGNVKMGSVNLEGYNELLDYVVPNEPDQSDLWIAVASGAMPMNKKMDPKEKEMIKKWIIDGARP